MKYERGKNRKNKIINREFRIIFFYISKKRFSLFKRNEKQFIHLHKLMNNLVRISFVDHDLMFFDIILNFDIIQIF